METNRQRLATARLAAGMTHKELSQLLGCSRVYVTQVLAGVRAFPSDWLSHLTEALPSFEALPAGECAARYSLSRLVGLLFAERRAGRLPSDFVQKLTELLNRGRVSAGEQAL